MRLLVEARQLVEREFERRVDGLERQVRLGFTARVRVRAQGYSWWSGSWSAASMAWSARYGQGLE